MQLSGDGAQLGERHVQALRSLGMDLQLPLTYLQNVLSLLRAGYYQKDELPHHFESLNTNAQRLQSMLDGLLLAMNSLEHPDQLQLTPLNVSSVLHDVRQNLRPLAHSYHCEIDFQTTRSLVPVHANYQALKHSVGSLLDTMVQSSESEVIELLAHHQGGKVMITLRDRGQSLSHATIDSMLERLGTTVIPSSHLPSSGFALYVAHNLVRSMNGSLHVQQQKDRRAVSFVLPKSEQLSLIS